MSVWLGARLAVYRSGRICSDERYRRTPVILDRGPLGFSVQVLEVFAIASSGMYSGWTRRRGRPVWRSRTELCLRRMRRFLGRMMWQLLRYIERVSYTTTTMDISLSCAVGRCHATHGGACRADRLCARCNVSKYAGCRGSSLMTVDLPSSPRRGLTQAGKNAHCRISPSVELSPLTGGNAWQFGERVFVRRVPCAWRGNLLFFRTLTDIQWGRGSRFMLPTGQVPMQHLRVAHPECRRVSRFDMRTGYSKAEGLALC